MRSALFVNHYTGVVDSRQGSQTGISRFLYGLSKPFFLGTMSTLAEEDTYVKGDEAKEGATTGPVEEELSDTEESGDEKNATEAPGGASKNAAAGLEMVATGLGSPTTLKEGAGRGLYLMRSTLVKPMRAAKAKSNAKGTKRPPAMKKPSKPKGANKTAAMKGMRIAMKSPMKAQTVMKAQKGMKTQKAMRAQKAMKAEKVKAKVHKCATCKCTMVCPICGPTGRQMKRNGSI